MNSSQLLPDNFTRLLVEAKRRTYASGGAGSEAAVPTLLPGSHQLEYRDGPFLYRDIYFGEEFFTGQETVYLNSLPVWSMSYAGGFTVNLEEGEAQRVGAFLQSSLRSVQPDLPYRGPKFLREDDLCYQNEVTGNLERFYGKEEILRSASTVYELRYMGGRLR